MNRLMGRIPNTLLRHTLLAVIFVALAALVLGQGLFLLTAWGINHTWYPSAAGERVLPELVATWGCTYALFFLLFAARGWSMPAFACWLGRTSYSVYLFHMLVLVLLISSGLSVLLRPRRPLAFGLEAGVFVRRDAVEK